MENSRERYIPLEFPRWEPAAFTSRERTQMILTAFRSRMQALGHEAAPDSRALAEALRQVEAALTDAFVSVEAGTVIIDHGTVPRSNVTEDRADCRALDPVVVQQVSTLVFQLAAEAATQMFRNEPDGVRLTALWLRAVHESVSARVAAMVRNHDGGVGQPVEDMTPSDRQRLARDVHDWVGSGLSLVDRNLDLYEIYQQRGAPTAQDRLSIARRALHALMDDTRRLVAELRTDQGDGRMREKLELFAHNAVPETEVEVRLTGDESRVPRHQREELFVIIRECLRNIDKHSQATKAAVDIDITDWDLTVTVEDDGVGFDVDARSQAPWEDPRTGHGLVSIRERAAGLGGILRIESSPGQGTRVHIVLALPNARASLALSDLTDTADRA
ncbi:histidine kinase/DNA gyrase B/HSP90-like ATPase [Nocardiopsis sp. Huas11]|uniref:sensor histidine kinase n=1 Tax=Nocardiopsis sp. Huas11 TaxID=2183912 RepID=UPI000EAEA950|nr:sensor histidine kinase [Nocardiopsis sp. Huas11]RKS09675.1 histidine kinase/DNA gyrase B/HSP90-like ATPase [Nocardiopsis sp. Huas11]